MLRTLLYVKRRELERGPELKGEDELSISRLEKKELGGEDIFHSCDEDGVYKYVDLSCEGGSPDNGNSFASSSNEEYAAKPKVRVSAGKSHSLCLGTDGV